MSAMAIVSCCVHCGQKQVVRIKNTVTNMLIMLFGFSNLELSMWNDYPQIWLPTLGRGNVVTA